MAAPTPAPTARMTAVTSTSFTVLLTRVSSAPALNTGALFVRAYGSADAWVSMATVAPPAVGSVLTAAGLTQGAAYEWCVRETNPGGEAADGTHGRVTPYSASSKLERVLQGLEDLLKTLTTLNGYSLTVAKFDRQRQQLRDEELPCLFLNVSNETFEHYPDGLVESELTYTVTGALVATDPDKLSTELNALIRDFKVCLYSDLLLETAGGGVGLLAQHKLVSLMTDEGFLNPKACFVARCVATYRYTATAP